MKKRLDILVFERGLAESREKAKAIIMSGEVYVNNQKADKCGQSYSEDVEIEFRGKAPKYVSRGGLKLEKAINNFSIDLSGKITMDIGASTGGFTDCMLQNGASKVYSVDVGHGQLDWKLRSDERVVCMEKTNFRYLTRDQIDDDIDFASCDVSFISLTRILVPARKLLKDGAQMVVLIKPQFEAGRDKVGKKGVVRDKKVHEEVINRIVDFADAVGFKILHLDYSPIRGPEGNIEYLLHLEKDASRNEEVSLYDEATALKKFGTIEDEGTGISKTSQYVTLIHNAVEAAHGELEV
jgi:23S rRNA (cytidine1920-2'-O)/16S rRNA (cytidine1409-2'-O)-methyltransferase